MTSYPKQGTFRSRAWLKAVASLPCVLCSREGMTQAAHLNVGKGLGIKTHDAWCAALCVDCHARIDQGKDLSRQDRRDMMEAAVLLTIAELAKAGLVVVK
jgi:hypothetical protein